MSIKGYASKKFVDGFFFTRTWVINTTINNINTFYIEFFIMSYCINSFSYLQKIYIIFPKLPPTQKDNRYMT